MWYETDEDKRDRRISLLFVAVLVLIVATFLIYLQHTPYQKPIYTSEQGWNNAKSVVYNVIYKGHNVTLYEGCRYTDRIVNLSSCDYKPVEKHKNRATRTEIEHIVPASLFPVQQFPCWSQGRGVCEDIDPRVQAMSFDLHNLAPAIGQVNALRGNLRYGEKPGTFEPVDCVKGDVARVWLYAHLRHGVKLMPGEEEMFERWSKLDPVSPWESEREKRVRKHTFIANPFVKGQKPSASGSCSWE